MSDRSQYHPENMRKRFHELSRKREAILARVMPLREERDRIVQEAEAKAKVLVEQFRQIEKDEDLFGIDQERAALARALGGKTGRPE